MLHCQLRNVNAQYQNMGYLKVADFFSTFDKQLLFILFVSFLIVSLKDRLYLRTHLHLHLWI